MELEKRVKILIVDDEEDMLDSCQRILTHMEYECYTASSGREGIACVKRLGPDLVITDLRMPDVDGLEVLRECQAQDPGIIVVMLTAFATVQNAVEAMKMGAADYLQKPFTAKQLHDVIERHLQPKHAERAVRTVAPAGRRQTLLLGNSEKIRTILGEIELIARTNANVLITGESGTGKELAARLIHQASTRSEKPFVPVDCACLSENLLETELFGHVKGAFTSATHNKTGLFEVAHQGTLFFDEISHLSLSAQAKMLRVLQERQFRPVGGKKLVDVDVRILSATNQPLEEDVRRNRFSEDLYFRLNVMALHLPSLRERIEDLPILLRHFIRKYAARPNPDEIQIHEAALERLMEYPWPGNVRELENVTQRCLAMLDGAIIQSDHLPNSIRWASRSLPTPTSERLSDAVKITEREQILRALRACRGERIKAAKLLEISRKSLWQKIKLYEIMDQEIMQSEEEGSDTSST